MTTSLYAHAYTTSRGPGDARPTAQQVISDEQREDDLTGKIILITACSSGLGIETARALKSTGGTLYLTARNLDKPQVRRHTGVRPEQARQSLHCHRNRVALRFAGVARVASDPGGIRTGLQRPTIADYLVIFKAGVMDSLNVIMNAQQAASTSAWAAVNRQLEGRGGRYREQTAISEPVKKGWRPIDPGYVTSAYDATAAARCYDE